MKQIGKFILMGLGVLAIIFSIVAFSMDSNMFDPYKLDDYRPPRTEEEFFDGWSINYSTYYLRSLNRAVHFGFGSILLLSGFGMVAAGLVPFLGDILSKEKKAVKKQPAPATSNVSTDAPSEPADQTTVEPSGTQASDAPSDGYKFKHY